MPDSESTRSLHSSSSFSREPQETQPLLGEEEPCDQNSQNYFLVFKTAANILTAISCVLLVSIFFSLIFPYGRFASRGSGFTAFNFAVVVFINGNIGTALATNAQILCLAINAANFFLLLCDMIFEAAFPELLRRDGGIVILLALFAAISSLFNVISGLKIRKVARQSVCKLERPGVLGTFVILLFFLSVLASFVNTAVRGYDSQLSTSSLKSLQNDKLRVFLQCKGISKDNNPTILLEGGETSSIVFQTWVGKLEKDNIVGRYCYWDRPGIGFSDNFPGFLTAGLSVDLLSEALQDANESLDNGYVLVSHGIGGIYSRIFAARNIHSVKGLMLVDTIHEDQLKTATFGYRPLKYIFKGLSSSIGLNYWPYALFRRNSRQDRVYGKWVIQNDRYIKNKLTEALAGGTTTLTEIYSANEALPKGVPLSVISSGKMGLRYQDWLDNQNKLTSITANLRDFVVVDDADHNIWESISGEKALNKTLKRLYDSAKDFKLDASKQSCNDSSAS